MPLAIIAHSLGNRVLLTVMNILGQEKKYQDKVEHVFMWQPAVPDTALSNDPKKDTSVLRNWNFVHAHKGAKKIIVLHSKYDNILGPNPNEAPAPIPAGETPEQQEQREKIESLKRDDGELAERLTAKLGSSYELATDLGLPLWDETNGALFWNNPRFYQGWARNLTQAGWEDFLEELDEENLFDTSGTLSENLSPKAYEFFLPILYYRRLGKQAAEDFCKTIRAVADTDFEVKKPRPAMGHGGPDRDNFIRGLERQGKLTIVPQNDWLFSHSGMRVPSEDLYKFVYDDEIMEKILGGGGFGAY